METFEIITRSAEETKKIGFVFAKNLKKKRTNLKQATIVALKGNLGSGKTTFIQGLAKWFNIKESVLSPTFLVLKEFPIAVSGFKSFYHIDAYRLKNPVEILELGFKDLIKNPENIVIIEWAEKIKKVLPKNILWVKFINFGKSKRKIIYETTYFN